MPVSGSIGGATASGGIVSLGIEADAQSSLEPLAPVRADFSGLSIKELRRLCDSYFLLLDSDAPPECLMADYQAACEELQQRQHASKAGSGKPVPPAQAHP